MGNILYPQKLVLWTTSPRDISEVGQNQLEYFSWIQYLNESPRMHKFCRFSKKSSDSVYPGLPKDRTISTESDLDASLREFLYITPSSDIHDEHSLIHPGHRRKPLISSSSSSSLSSSSSAASLVLRVLTSHLGKWFRCLSTRGTKSPMVHTMINDDQDQE